MLRISDAQMSELVAPVDDAFVERMARFLRERIPDAVSDLDDIALRARVRDELVVARSLRLQRRRSHVQLIAISIIGGEGGVAQFDDFCRHFAEVSEDPDGEMNDFFHWLRVSAEQASAERKEAG